ncbi:MAG: barstar family protein [Bdellovibrionales bacterium]|nr:barstar family protein [Bdellovibrionales bacterium]
MKSAIVAVSAMMMSFQVLASGSVLINGKEVKSQEDLHGMFAKQLNFPANYGKNLDALYDTLSTDSSGQAVIKIKSLSILKSKLGNDYVEALIRTISDASADNPKIVLLLE